MNKNNKFRKIYLVIIFVFFITANLNSQSQISINYWYGKNLNFGILGSPQRWLDILGNVLSPNGIKSLKYSLYNSLWNAIYVDSALWIGPQKPNEVRRLYRKGDFVINIDRTILTTGIYYIILTATDSANNVLVDTLNFYYNATTSWPIPYEVRWENLNSNIENGAQVVDGKWQIDGNLLKVSEEGYDRLVAIGSQNLSSYIVRTEIAIDSINPKYSFPSYGAGVGLLLKWNGHTNNTPSRAGWQPAVDFLPYGAIAWFAWESPTQSYFQLLGNYLYEIGKDDSTPKMQIGETYVFLTKCEVRTNDTTYYFFKYWKKNENEPQNWILQGKHPTSRQPVSGSILLLAHHVYASFGKTAIVPLNYQKISIVNNPEDFYGVESSPAQFSISTSGSGPKTFQWYKNNYPISGANDSILIINNLSLSDDNSEIYCEATNYLGTVKTQTVRLFVTPLGQRVPYDKIASYEFANNDYENIYDEIHQPYVANLELKKGRILNLNNGVRIGEETTVESDSAIGKFIRKIRSANEFTIEIWLKNNLEKFSQNDISLLTIYSKQDSTSWIHFGLTKQSSVYNYIFSLRTYNGDFIQNVLITDSAIATNNIDHIVIAKTKDSKLKLYKNGYLVKEITVNGDLSQFDVLSLNRLFVSIGESNFWYGDIFYVAFYSRALSFTEISHNNKFGYFVPSASSKATVKCYLQGPYVANLNRMKSAYKLRNMLPNSQPYVESLWNHTLNEYAAIIPDSVVDWILVELRSDLSPSSKVASRAVFIKENGNIIEVNGGSQILFEGISPGFYHVAILHRNHLRIVSSNKLPIDYRGTVLIDFTKSNEAAAESQNLIDLNNGIYGIRSGDVNGDRIINIDDIQNVWKSENGESNNYFNMKSDVNLDGTVNAKDLYEFILINLNHFSNY